MAPTRQPPAVHGERALAQPPRWQGWWSLDGKSSATEHVTPLLPGLLFAAAAAIAASMPLVWHRLFLPRFIYYGPPVPDYYNGVRAQSWLLVLAALAITAAVRSLTSPVGGGVKSVTSAIAFLGVVGMTGDHIDWTLRGTSAYVPPYFGPGFYVAGVGVLLLVAACIVAWRRV